jgi:uncharacterized protein YkwD
MLLTLTTVATVRCSAQYDQVSVQYQNEFLTALNAYRAEYGLMPLNHDTSLEPPAEHHAIYSCALLQARPDAFTGSHDETVKASGVKALGSMQSRYKRYGIDSFGECIVFVNSDSVASPTYILKLWCDSPPHNRLLLSPFRCCALSVVHFRSDESVITLGVLALR